MMLMTMMTQVIREQLQKLQQTETKGEQQKAAALIDDARAGISGLSYKLNDAAHLLAGYDQRTYAEVKYNLSARPCDDEPPPQNKNLRCLMRIPARRLACSPDRRCPL